MTYLILNNHDYSQSIVAKGIRAHLFPICKKFIEFF